MIRVGKKREGEGKGNFRNSDHGNKNYHDFDINKNAVNVCHSHEPDHQHNMKNNNSSGMQ